MSRASGTMKRLTMELGGKGPCIIFNDANIDKAASDVAGNGLVNAGQFCGAPTRIIVQDGVYDEFIDKLQVLYKARKPGYWKDEDTSMGPLISQVQQDRVMGYINKGKKSAELICGGNKLDRDGFFVEPTIFGNCKPDIEIMCEEIFGPVTSVIKFSDAEEALNIANNSDYGLVGAVYSKD